MSDGVCKCGHQLEKMTYAQAYARRDEDIRSKNNRACYMCTKCYCIYAIASVEVSDKDIELTETANQLGRMGKVDGRKE
jgi:hypothetical protein